MTRPERDSAHWRTHPRCWHEPHCPRCWFYAYLDLLRLIIRLKGEERA